MSDIFNHEADAWDSLDWHGVEEDGSELHPYNFKINHLHYHTECKDVIFLAETEKARLIEFPSKKQLWIPKKASKEVTENSIWIHTKILKDILKRRLRNDNSETT